MAGTTLEYNYGYRSCCKYHSHSNVNIILSAPHGGVLQPDHVPDRTDNVHSDENNCQITVTKDICTDEFAENVADELNKIGHVRPFVIIGRWSRKKVDFNREIHEATLNHPEAMSAYESYHRHLKDAINQVNHSFGKGLLIDIHGHGIGK